MYNIYYDLFTFIICVYAHEFVLVCMYRTCVRMPVEARRGHWVF